MRSIRFVAPELIPGAVLERKDLTVSAKRVYAQIRYTQGHQKGCQINLGWLSARLAMSRQAASRAVQCLEEASLLTVRRKNRQASYYSVRHLPLKKFFLPLYGIEDSRYSGSMTLVLSYLKFRQGGNGVAWPHIKAMCDDLGMSKAAVCRTLKALERAGFIAVIRAHGGLKQGNRYTVSEKAFCVSDCGARADSRASKRDTKINNHKELKELNHPRTSSVQELSARRRILTDQGIHWLVAEQLSQDHSTAEIENAVINANGQRELHRKTGRKHVSIAAYVVGSLNTARREKHTVELNSFMQAKKAEWLGRKNSPIAAMTAERIDELKRQALNLKTLHALGLTENRIEQVRRRIGVA